MYLKLSNTFPDLTKKTENSFFVRAATLDDTIALAGFTREMLVYEQKLSGMTNELYPWAASVEEIEKQMRASNTRFFVAECGQRIVGFIRPIVFGRKLQRNEIGWRRWIEDLVERAIRQSFIFLMRRPRAAMQVQSGYIAGTFVAVDARGLGIGKALVAAAEEWFRLQGLKKSELHVLFNNEVARHMWKELGYEPLALRMQKKL
jgi:GNAT superfamily N-acetyltransferase